MSEVKTKSVEIICNTEKLMEKNSEIERKKENRKRGNIEKQGKYEVRSE